MRCPRCGALAAGEVAGGQASYTAFGAFGTEWSFVGAGDHLGTGHASFLIQDRGAVVAGMVVSGVAQYARIGALGAGWTFHG